MHWFLKSASEVYAVDYFGIIIVMSLLELVTPRREPGPTLRMRWISNFGISILSTIAIRLLFPIVGASWAELCAQRGWGLFNRIAAPATVTFVLTLVVLDLVAYAQHYLLHRVPWLWRLHRAHHTDHDCDFSTGARFHPLESIFTNVAAIGAIAILGAPPFAVFISQLVSTAIGFAEHGNVRMPALLDSLIRFAIVLAGESGQDLADPYCGGLAELALQPLLDAEHRLKLLAGEEAADEHLWVRGPDPVDPYPA